MSEVGLTETVHSGKGSDARKFELWLQGTVLYNELIKPLPTLLAITTLFWILPGRHEVWVLQAPARDVKETWITEIKRVLLNQFHQLKGQTMGGSGGGGPPSARVGGASGPTSGSGQSQKISQLQSHGHSASIPNGSSPCSSSSSPFGHK